MIHNLDELTSKLEKSLTYYREEFNGNEAVWSKSIGHCNGVTPNDLFNAAQAIKRLKGALERIEKMKGHPLPDYELMQIIARNALTGDNQDER
jgi:hypothetical protein